MPDPHLDLGELKAVVRALGDPVAADHAEDLLRGINLLPEELRELDQLIDRMATAERLLPEDAPPRPVVSTTLGLLLAARSTADAAAQPDDRAEALRRLRRADRHGRADDQYTVLARLLLLRLLVLNQRGPRRAFGRSSNEGRHSPVPDLVEASEILDRLAAASRPRPEVLDIVIDQLTTLERHMPKGDPARRLVVPHLGLLLADRSLADDSARSGDRAEALRRLRWAHRHGPTRNSLAVRARLALLNVLAPDRALNERGRSLHVLIWEVLTSGGLREDGDLADAVLES